MRHTELVVPADTEVEIVREPCACVPGRVCTADDPFAAICPRRMPDDRWLVLRKGETTLYVRKLHPELGGVDWTARHERAHRFTDRGQAALVQEQIVARFGHEVAVVFESANQRAMAELNRVAEW